MRSAALTEEHQNFAFTETDPGIPDDSVVRSKLVVAHARLNILKTVVVEPGDLHTSVLQIHRPPRAQRRFHNAPDLLVASRRRDADSPTIIVTSRFGFSRPSPQELQLPLHAERPGLVIATDQDIGTSYEELLRIQEEKFNGNPEDYISLTTNGLLEVYAAMVISREEHEQMVAETSQRHA